MRGQRPDKPIPQNDEEPKGSSLYYMKDDGMSGLVIVVMLPSHTEADEAQPDQQHGEGLWLGDRG